MLICLPFSSRWPKFFEGPLWPSLLSSHADDPEEAPPADLPSRVVAFFELVSAPRCPKVQGSLEAVVRWPPAPETIEPNALGVPEPIQPAMAYGLT